MDRGTGCEAGVWLLLEAVYGQELGCRVLTLSASAGDCV